MLTPAEADALFAVLKSLAAEGRTVILVTHKLREVLEGSDRVTVLRDGRVVARLVTAETSADEIAAAMTGRAVELDRIHAAGTPGDVVLDVSGLATPAVHDVGLAVRAGEIVGIAGVAGNGQSELVEALAGLRPVTAGRVALQGQDITHASATERRLKGAGVRPRGPARGRYGAGGVRRRQPRDGPPPYVPVLPRPAAAGGRPRPRAAV